MTLEKSSPAKAQSATAFLKGFLCAFAGEVFAFHLDLQILLIVLRWVYPGEVLLIAILLAVVPYLLIRGPVSRIARRRRSKNRKLTMTGG